MIEAPHLWRWIGDKRIDGAPIYWEDDRTPLSEIDPPNIDGIWGKPLLNREDTKAVIQRMRAERQNWRTKKAKEQAAKEKKKSKAKKGKKK